MALNDNMSIKPIIHATTMLTAIVNIITSTNTT